MKNPFSKQLLMGFGLAGLVGCSTVAPAQLIEARQAYASSADGLASKYSPTELYDARKVLDRANKSFDANGDSWEVRDLAYVATRKVQLADSRARAEQDRRLIADAVKQGVRLRDTQMKDTMAELQAARERLKDERNQAEITTHDLQRDAQARSDELARTNAQLDTERQARMTAEEKLAGAMKDLATVAAVKEESRGVVITLSGSVLFVSGKYALLETAKTKLDQVAEALKAQSPDKKITIEGHTDSQGSDSINQPLSLNRAMAVRDYLVTRGVAPDRISAVGLGSARPLVDNNTAENRANNRRVEIIIGNPAVSVR